MRILLDTHALLWSLAEPQRLGEQSRALLEDPDNDVFVSAASVWEIEIKRALGKLEAPEDLLPAIEEADFGSLPMTAAHALLAGRLPRHHDDPFDRMLVAQAMTEKLLFMTADAKAGAYGLALQAADR